MANMRITKNRVAARLAENQANTAKKFVTYGLPVVAILSVASSQLFPLWIGVWVLALLLSMKTTQNTILEAGAAGENITQNILSSLPADYTVYNQVPLPNNRTGKVAEADFVVIGSNGVFIVENKDYSGIPDGSENDDKWRLFKTGRGGTQYASSITNPVRQVRRHTAILAGFFKERGIKAWITPLVSLSKNNRTDHIESKVPVLPVSIINSAIEDHPGKLMESERGKASKMIDELVG